MNVNNAYLSHFCLSKMDHIDNQFISRVIINKGHLNNEKKISNKNVELLLYHGEFAAKHFGKDKVLPRPNG